MKNQSNPIRITLILAPIVALAVTMAGCAEKNVHKILKGERNAPEGPTTVLAVYEAWFGEPDHMSVGYSSQDRVVLQKQIEQAKSLGVTGFVVDWYGTRKPFIDTSFSQMQQVAVEKNFKVALMYDEVEDDLSRMTENAIAQLDYAYKNYIGPNAPAHNAYLTYKGRPMIFVWPRGGKTDWPRVREHLNTWATPPLLIYKDEPSPYTELFDGYYAWIHPGSQGFKPDGSNWGEQYLQNFYSKMSSRQDGKIVVGTAWPGFDDARASWSENRYMDDRCGRTFEQTLHYPRRYFGPENPLPFLLIATWNDHEEGTAIERGLATAAPPIPNKPTSKCGAD